MHAHGFRRVLPLAVVLILAACGDGDAQGAVASRSAESGRDTGAAQSSAAAPARASSATDRFEASVSSAPFAGTHHAAGPMTCMMFNGVWQAVHEEDRTDGLSGMLLQVKEVPAAGGTSDKLSFTLTFGQMGDETGTAGMLDLWGAEAGGDARATIEREGAGATIRVEGTAQSRARVTATLRCATVDFMR